jgi:uncharacterized SAM-binding protein YcdF (DUF218 family)
MELILVKAVAALALPPGGNIVLGIAGLLLWRRARVLAAILMTVSLASLLVLSTPRVVDALYQGLESFEPLTPGVAVADEIGAIVVLSGGRNGNAREHGGETVSHRTLVRLHYGARLQRQTGLPLLVSGGSVFGDSTPEAALMGKVLEEDFNVPVRWLENRSRTTAENAQFTAQLLAGEGVTAILLVTHAMHMPRAAEAFEAQGVRVYAAPTGFRFSGRAGAGVLDWLPSADSLDKSRTALHEYLGRLWYAIRY